MPHSSPVSAGVVLASTEDPPTGVPVRGNVVVGDDGFEALFGAMVWVSPVAAAAPDETPAVSESVEEGIEEGISGEGGPNPMGDGEEKSELSPVERLANECWRNSTFPVSSV